ncbi:MAG TPA: cytochrome C oxidase subunit I [Chitinophagaceae bacterium]|nr:cytochrome C oxidase subunit I [Chitinophagaceae bacterium]
MFAGSTTENHLARNTTHKAVLPFYLYAGLSFLAGTIVLLFSTKAFTQHYFHPHTLAITHIMALGWGTMIILGASHQLVPVLIEGSLYSNKLAYTSFILAAAGIPMLVYGFYVFDMGWPAKWGGRFVLLAILCYIINLATSMVKSNTRNVHAIFILTASFWLFLTAFLGLVLVYNFTYPFLPQESLDYLPLHAHTGVIGWFLLLVMGVGSRLLPMFMVSKYVNNGLLWTIYVLVNSSLLFFLFSFLYFPGVSYSLPIAAIFLALLLFGYYCYNAFHQRIRRQLDEPMKFSLLSVMMMLLPIIFLASITGWLLTDQLNTKMVLIYGFVIFFGWITAIIFGMTFKTLPFIVWNKVYHQKAGLGKTPNPKDLFNSRVFIIMALTYLPGFILFIIGAYLSDVFVLNFATCFLLLAALLYNWNVIRVILHKPLPA